MTANRRVFFMRITWCFPSYANEIRTAEFGCGLDRDSSDGVNSWSVLSMVIRRYLQSKPISAGLHHLNKDDLTGSGNKRALRKSRLASSEMMFPVVVIVSFISSKGFDLSGGRIIICFRKMCKLCYWNSDCILNDAFLGWPGSSEKLSPEYPFFDDVTLAQEIYAAVFLMPSRFGCCGFVSRWYACVMVHYHWFTRLEVCGIRSNLTTFIVDREQAASNNFSVIG